MPVLKNWSWSAALWTCRYQSEASNAQLRAEPLLDADVAGVVPLGEVEELAAAELLRCPGCREA